MKFKKGDWAFHEYEIKQILSVEGDRVTEVSCGSFRTCGHSLDCFPLTLENKRKAEYVEYYEEQVRKSDRGIAGLNWPDIHRAFCSFFEDSVNAKTAKDLEAVQEQIKKFAEGIIDGIGESRKLTLNGVRVFGR